MMRFSLKSFLSYLNLDSKKSHSLDNVGAFICSVSTQEGPRSRSAHRITSIVRKAGIRIVGDKGVLCSNWAQAASSMQEMGIPKNNFVHPLLWRYIPQIDTYITIGTQFPDRFQKYENFQACARPGEIGVNLSFYRACTLLLESELDFLVWFEDDANINSNLGSELTKLLLSNPPEFDFVRLVDIEKKDILDIFLTESEFLTYPTGFSFAQMVLISRQGAKKFRNYLEKFGPTLPLDWIIYNVQSDITRSISFNSYFVNSSKVNFNSEETVESISSIINAPRIDNPFPNWFNFVASNFVNVPNSSLKDSSQGVRILQIGAFTGDTTEWLLRNRTIQYIHDVDTWQGSGEEHSELDFSQVEAVYDSRILGGSLVQKYKMTSDAFFELAKKEDSLKSLYDFIYIDGDHTASQTAIDCLHAFGLLEIGGIMAMDDYLWGAKDDPFLEPKRGVDAFLRIIEGRYTTLIHSYQVWIRKIA